MHALPPVRAVASLRRRGVNPDAHLRGEALLPAVIEESALNGDAALDRGPGCREGHAETVGGMVDSLSAVRGEVGAEGLVVPPDEISPCLVADRLDQLGRSHDVSEDERAKLGLEQVMQ